MTLACSVSGQHLIIHAFNTFFLFFLTHLQVQVVVPLICVAQCYFTSEVWEKNQMSQIR